METCKSHVCLALHDNLILSTQGAKEIIKRKTNFQRRKIDYENKFEMENKKIHIVSHIRQQNYEE